MASDLLMSAPICLIENSNGQFVVNQEAVDILTTVTQPVVVVAIVGLYRTGKSYLMNKLAGQSTGKQQNDTWIFTLAVLLSSIFIYNSMGTINQQAMDQLYYVTELTDNIKAKSSPGTEQMNDSMEFASFFPDFVWTVRDFILELEIDGQPITSDQYLENALKLEKGTSEEARICIQKFFLNRKCSIFSPPAYGKMLKQLETLHDDLFDVDFVESTNKFCNYIFSTIKTKTLPGGGTVNGPRLGNLVLTYVEAIKSGNIPCMENTVLVLAERENSAAVQRALTLYEGMMRQKVQFPTDTIQELLDVHIICKSEALNIFIKDSFKDVNQKYQTTLEIQLEAKLDDFCKQNEKKSLEWCTSLLQDIFSPLEEQVKQGFFSKPGGYGIFLQKRQELMKKYNQQPKKGIQADKTLEEYLKSKETVAEAVNQTDQILTEKEKVEKELQRKAKAAADAARELEIQIRRQEQIRLENERRQQEQIRKMAEDMKAQRMRLLEEKKRVQALRLQKQERLLKEQKERERAEHQSRIQILQDQLRHNHSRKDCIVSRK